MPKLGIGLTRVSQRLTGAPWGDFGVPASASVIKLLILLVPGEGFEPPTNGLQNRCSTTELTRQEVKITSEFSLPI
jgi:hypothetical protein